jgi:hypothetical protein
MRRRVEEIAAKLADIFEDGAIVVDDVVPEGAGGETLAENDRATGGQRRAARQYAAGGVVERQADIDAVSLGHLHGALEGEHDPLDTVVIDVRSLRQAGRAARVDVEAVVIDGERRSCLRRDAAARNSGEGLDEVAPFSARWVLS